MSFSSDVKQELAQVPVLSDCCAQARAYGMLLFGRMFSVSEISFVTENENIAKLYSDVIKELFDITPSVSSGVSNTRFLLPTKRTENESSNFSATVKATFLCASTGRTSPKTAVSARFCAAFSSPAEQ